MHTRQRIADLLAGFSDPDVQAVADFCAYLQYRSTQVAAETKAETKAAPAGLALTTDTWPAAAAGIGTLLAWATQVVEAMTEASFWVEYERELAAAEQRAGRYRLRTRLSALTDCGRWYFPNLQADQVGMDKELAYRGIRQLALNAILNAFAAVQPPPDETDEQRKLRQESIVRAKRFFVSEVQAALQAGVDSRLGPPREE
jgi:hypothetical protein